MFLDRMVGYKISPFLWAKLKEGFSAGRVQSVALRIICDREMKLMHLFQKNTGHWMPHLSVKGRKKTYWAKFYGTEKKMNFIHKKKCRRDHGRNYKKKNLMSIDVKKERVERRHHCRLQPVPYSRKHPRH